MVTGKRNEKKEMEIMSTQREIQVNERLPLLQSIPLSLQHLFAMFGSTVLVPILFGVNPATILLMNGVGTLDRKSTRLNSSHVAISYAVFCLKKKTKQYLAL